MSQTTCRKHPEPPHLAARVRVLQSRLLRDGLIGLLVTNTRDIRYLTGFVGEDSWCYVPSRGLPTVISDPRFESHIPQEAPHVRVVMRVVDKTQREDLPQAFARMLGSTSTDRKVGLQARYLAVQSRHAVAKAVGTCRVCDYDDGLLDQRSIKDAREIHLLRKAVTIQQQAFLETRAFIEVGMTENEVCAFLEYRMRALGAEGVAFPSIVAFDDHANHHHAVPGSRKVKPDSSILIDWGACVGGYRSDMTRVLHMGRPKKHLAEAHKAVEEAMYTAIDRVGPGVPIKAIDDAAKHVLKKVGHTLGQSLGHGIGLDLHEEPGIRQVEGVLKPGQVITIEPGIYLGAKGGVRLEDDILVTDKGYKNLCDLPTSLEWSVVM